MPSPILFLAPLWLVAEISQLVVADKYVGIAKVRAGIDLRDEEPSRRLAMAWSLGLCAYWLWMLAALSSKPGRGQILAMIAISLIGYLARRSSPFKAIIVILTLEGALRIGMLLSICILIWKNL